VQKETSQLSREETEDILNSQFGSNTLAPHGPHGVSQHI
jgi:hypothetical protein